MVTISAGSLIYSAITGTQVNALGIYAGLCFILMSFVMSIVHLGTFTSGALSEYTDIAPILTAIIIAPFMVAYVLATAEWMRSNT